MNLDEIRKWLDAWVRDALRDVPARRIIIAAVVIVIVAVGAAVGLTAYAKDDPQPDRQAAQTFLAALSRNDQVTAANATTAPADAQGALKNNIDALGNGARGTFTITKLSERKAASSAVSYNAEWSLPGTPTKWTYQGSLPMIKDGQTWKVRWTASDLHPQLSDGFHFKIARTSAPRGDLLDSAGQPLFTLQDVVTVGINPSQVTDLNSLAAKLAAVPSLQTSAADIVTSVKAASPDQFVPVITLRRPDYDQIRDKVHELPGTQFQESQQMLGPATHFAQPLLGRIGEATQELIKASNGKIASGDQTGLSGLQRAFNDQLMGTPGITIEAVQDGTDTAVLKLAEVSPPIPGKAVQLTLDRATQTAAEQALAKVVPQAAIVVTQPSSGKLLAVATSAATQTNIGLDGQFPPGSTFKIATYTAALSANPTLTPTTAVECPATIAVNGQVIRNENNFSKGKVPLSSAFAFSCNTTAATLGRSLPAGALLGAAKSLGLGAKWSLPVESFSGSLPEPPVTPANELAADSYGQGKVLVSPLLMAEMAGAASTGAPIAPSIVVGQQAKPGTALPAPVTASLNTLMRDVVTVPGATGRALAGLPGQVRGKTGTAEFGTAVPPQSHSWFAGTRGDLAFSVFIYGGGNSDSATGAVAVTKTLLTAIPG